MSLREVEDTQVTEKEQGKSGFFFVHTHALPEAIDRRLVRGMVVVVEQSPERLIHYYGRGVQPRGPLTFLAEWSDLSRHWELSPETEIVFALEGTGGDFGLAKSLESYRELGLRIVQLCHWVSLPYIEGDRLTRLGRDLLRQLDELGMVLDVSHMSHDLLVESLDAFGGDVIASHVVLRDRLSPATPRANTLSRADVQLLAGRSALIGVPFLDDLVSSAGLTSDMDRSTCLDDVVHQVVDLVAIAGTDKVALGPDYLDLKGYGDMLGIPLAVPAELDTSHGLSALCGRLGACGLSTETVEGITYRNAARFFQRTCDVPDSMSHAGTPSGAPHLTAQWGVPWTFQQPHSPAVSADARAGRSRAPSLPTHAWISLSNYCNLACLHCRRRYRQLTPKDAERDTSPGLWRAIVEDILPNLESLILGGNNNSEVTCATRFPDIVRHLSALPGRTLRLSVQTNGSRIADDLLESLVSMDTVFNISVEGGTQETTARIRGIPLAYLSRRIKRINMLRASNRSTARVVLSFTAMRSNIMELPELVEFAERNGVDEVSVMFLLPATSEWNSESPVHDIDRVNRTVEESYHLCERWHVKLLAPSIGPVDRDAICERPWYSVSVNGNGDVRFCCLEDSPAVGNLLVSSLAEIWHSAQAGCARAQVNGPKPPGECGACVLRNLPTVSARALSSQLAR